MKFSVFTVMTPDLTPQELVTSLKEYGYDGVEWRFKETPKEIRQEEPTFWRNNLCTIPPDSTEEQLSSWLELTKGTDISVSSITPYLQCGDLTATEHVLQVAHKLGAEKIRVGVPRYDRSRNYNDLFEEANRYLNEVEGMCKHYQIKGLVETHHETIAPSASLAHRLVKQFDPECIGVLYDPGNMVFEGYENHRMGLELLGPHLAHVHVKNASWKSAERRDEGTLHWQPEWALIENGVVDWKQVLQDLKSVGYDGFIGMEDFSSGLATKESLKHNIDWINKLLQDS